MPQDVKLTNISVINLKKKFINTSSQVHIGPILYNLKSFKNITFDKVVLGVLDAGVGGRGVEGE